MDKKKESSDRQPDDTPHQTAGDRDPESEARDAAISDVADEMNSSEIESENSASEEAVETDDAGAPDPAAPAVEEVPATEAAPAEAETPADAKLSAEEDSTADADSTTETEAESQQSDAEADESADEPAVQSDEVDANTEPVSEQELIAARDELLTQLLGDRRLLIEKVKEVATEHARLAAAAGSNVATEIKLIYDAIRKKDGEARDDENQQILTTAGTLEQFTRAVDQLYDALPAAAASVAEAIEARPDDRLEVVGEDLRETLTTYRQGLEIISRMFDRLLNRKPSLIPMEVNFGEVDADVSEVTDPTQFTTAVEQLVGLYHDTRDKNYHLIREVKTDCEQQIQKAKTNLKQVLSAMDGIDSGLQNETETRAAAGDTSELDEQVQEVVASWYGAYDSLSVALDELIANSELTRVAVETGRPFDPETMEPQGVVENSELNDDDVGFVLRQGFSFCGELIRPALVEVVKNS